MKKLRKLPMRLNKAKILESWAIFWCDGCKQEVEKPLGNGKVAKSCGSFNCKNSKGMLKHGETKVRLYKIWSHMKQRILNPNSKDYKDYGGRGITVCPEWTDCYIEFRDWALSNGYADNLTIDRINNNGNYEPSNCRFITNEEQQRNRRSNVIKSMEMANEIRYLYKTGKYTQKELAKMFNISETHMSKIINNKIWKELKWIKKH